MQAYTDRHLKTCADIHRHTQTYTDIHRHTQTHTDTHRHTQTYTDIHRHTNRSRDRLWNRLLGLAAHDKLHAGKHTHTSHISNHLMLAHELSETLVHVCANFSSVLYELFPFQYLRESARARERERERERGREGGRERARERESEREKEREGEAEREREGERKRNVRKGKRGKQQSVLA